MKKTYLLPCLAVLSLCVFAGPAGAYYGTNITIPDGKTPNGSGVGGEDNEVEPGMATGQIWDLEGFFINGTTLTMIGGYNFMNGQSGNGQLFTSGDIFISSEGSYGYDPNSGVIIDSRDQYYAQYNYNFGYEYVLDIDWNGANTTFNIVELSGAFTTEGVYYNLNEGGTPPTSNPWRYVSGGQTIGTGSFSNLGTITDSGFAGWSGNNIHYAVSFDLTSLLSSAGLWGDELYFHFTMGCGNDNMIGHTTAPVPEPATMLLLGSGLVGLAGVARKKARRKEPTNR